MISKNIIFNCNTVNVFTDASVKKHNDGITESIAGSLLQYQFYDENHQIKSNEIIKCTRLIPSTNNEGEIYAILMGIQMCIEHKSKSKKDYKYNLFSDSKISIFGLREWYKSWISNGIIHNDLINSSGEVIKNKQIFLRCFNSIITSKINIDLIHIRGHMNNDPKKYKQFIDNFVSSNYFSEYPSDDLAMSLIYYNDIVDRTTRDMLLPNHQYDIPTISLNNYNEDKWYSNIVNKNCYLFEHTPNLLYKNKNEYEQMITYKNRRN